MTRRVHWYDKSVHQPFFMTYCIKVSNKSIFLGVKTLWGYLNNSIFPEKRLPTMCVGLLRTYFWTFQYVISYIKQKGSHFQQYCNVVVYAKGRGFASGVPTLYSQIWVEYELFGGHISRHQVSKNCSGVVACPGVRCPKSAQASYVRASGVQNVFGRHMSGRQVSKI